MAESPVQLLLPPLRQWARDLPADITLALARADAIQPEAWLTSLPPSAALARLGEGDVSVDEVHAHRWLRADPAWLRADINGARLSAIGPMLAVSRQDADAFCVELSTLFDDAGIRLEMPHPERWYLRLSQADPLPRVSTPAEALGADLFDHRPEGSGASRWRQLDGEAQVILHNHPGNAERTARGLMPVNGLWLWGDAGLPDPSGLSIPTIHSGDPLLRGMARLAMLEPATRANGLPGGASGLYDLRDVPAAQLHQCWLQPSLQAMKSEGRRMDWLSEEGDSHRLAPAQRWRFWRRQWQPRATGRKSE